MTIVVTGATGHLGRFAVESLLERGVPAEQIVATGRQVEKLADLAERGVVVRTADFTQPETLAEAFAGADKVLLVSSSEIGQRVPQHKAAIDAAVAAGVSHLVYTSIAKADTTTMKLAAEHQATEQLIRDSGLTYTLLRNSWYHENYTGQLPVYLEHGVVGSAGEGRVSGATRADYAAAAAAVLTGEGHENAVYELGGDSSFSLGELAATVSELSGKQVAYADIPVEALVGVLAGAGLPQPFAEVLADTDVHIAKGDLEVTSGDLSRLIGRPTTSLKDALAGALASV